MRNANENDECEWRMILGNQCSFPLRKVCAVAALSMKISRPTKHSLSDRSLHVLIHFVAFAVRIRTNGIAPVLIIYARLFLSSECELRMRQNESLRVAIGASVNVLSDGKPPHTHGRRRVARAARRKNYTGPLIAFVIRIRRSRSVYVKWNLSFTIITLTT